MLAFVLAHEAILAGVGVAVLDLVFAINPAFQSNGILHWVFTALGSVASKSDAAPKAPGA